MYAKILLFLLSLTASFSLAAQTKRISHKSHSGSDVHFAAIVAGSVFDDDASNFGLAPEPLTIAVELDSIVFLSDSVAVMVTREYKLSGNGRKKLIRAVRDTVTHHPALAAKYSLKEIKQNLSEWNYFSNPVSSVKIIGYKRTHKAPPPPKKAEQPAPTPAPAPAPEQQQPRQQNSAPIVQPANYSPPPSGFSDTLMVLAIACSAFFAGLMAWLHNRYKRHEELV